MLLLALLSALAVGVGFGFYPAWRAAWLEPVEALRQE
jgi:putative ABC transport system permease protein